MGGKAVCMCNVSDVGKVEEVGVVAQLKPGFLISVYFHHWRDQLHVAFAEDSCGAESTS
jgi:hypothetical protein